MHQRKIPSTGEMLPVVGCGTWRTFDVGAKPADRAPLAEVLRMLFDAGGSVIDSSPMYGSAEGVVGDLLAAAGTRSKAFIATKVWTSGRDNGIAQMTQSMRLLKTDRIDLMQIHNLLDWRAHLPTLRAWKAEGRIRAARRHPLHRERPRRARSGAAGGAAGISCRSTMRSTTARVERSCCRSRPSAASR